jgi:hypothetical protein
MRATRLRVSVAILHVRDLFSRAPSYRRLALLSALLVLATAALPAWQVAPQVVGKEALYLPLHYNIYFGVDQFGPWYGLFYPAVIGLGILLVNLGVQAAFQRTERMLAQFFAWTTLLLEIGLCTATLLMVLLNI